MKHIPYLTCILFALTLLVIEAFNSQLSTAYTQGASGVNAQTQTRAHFENCPKNLYVNYIIKS